MKKILLLSLAIFSINFTQAQNKMNNELDSVSYLLGAAIGGNVLKDIPEANKELIIQGLKDKLYGNPPVVVDPTNQMLGNYFQQKAERDAQASIQEGIQFLEQNGLSRDRIEYEYQGEKKPVDNNKTEDGKRKNRRVDFEFI
jgi:hypothetical protein